MQPEKPTPDQNAQPSPLAPADIVAQAAAAPILPPTDTRRPSVVLPIILMAWPAVGLILSIALYAIVNFLMATTAPTSSDTASLFGDSQPNPLRTIMNVCLFLVGAASVGLGPISFIAGLILLIVRLKK